VSSVRCQGKGQKFNGSPSHQSTREKNKEKKTKHQMKNETIQKVYNKIKAKIAGSQVANELRSINNRKVAFVMKIYTFKSNIWLQK